MVETILDLITQNSTLSECVNIKKHSKKDVYFHGIYKIVLLSFKDDKFYLICLRNEKFDLANIDIKQTYFKDVYNLEYRTRSFSDNLFNLLASKREKRVEEEKAVCKTQILS